MLNPFQIERLCNIVYLDELLKYENGENNLSNIMTNILNDGFEHSGKPLPALMSREEWTAVAESVKADPELSRLFIIKKVNDDKTGNRAFCFASSDTDIDMDIDMENISGSVYVVFRGTSGDMEWYDNAKGMFMVETPLQKDALAFVKAVRAEFPDIKTLTVAGHSKGGNKAQYCAVLGGAAVDFCVSVDGQGFSNLFFEKYNAIIESSKLKITSIAERRDFVNCLGFYLKKPVFYSGRRGGKTAENPFGEPLPFFHCPDALRLKSGRPGAVAENAPISDVINSYVTYFLSQKNASKTEKTALGLISLMTDDRNFKNASEAVAEAALVFFELAANNVNFREELSLMLNYEKDVIAATLHMLNNHERHDEVMRVAMRLIAEKLLIKPRYFRYFVKCAEKFMLFEKRINGAKPHLDYIGHFLKLIFSHIEK